MKASLLFESHLNFSGEGSRLTVGLSKTISHFKVRDKGACTEENSGGKTFILIIFGKNDFSTRK